MLCIKITHLCMWISNGSGNLCWKMPEPLIWPLNYVGTLPIVCLPNYKCSSSNFSSVPLVYMSLFLSVTKSWLLWLCWGVDIEDCECSKLFFKVVSSITGIFHFCLKFRINLPISPKAQLGFLMCIALNSDQFEDYHYFNNIFKSIYVTEE